MNKILKIQNIKINENLSNQQEVFERIAEVAVENNFSSSKQLVIDGLSAREKQGTTGFMEGFAIPHTKAAAIKEAGIVIITLSEGIDWDSLDGQPARFIISLLIPESEGGTTHLSLLSSISRMLMHSEVRDSLLNASNQEEVLKELNQALSA
ncbi:PTS fructose transporter subunit IIA [Priestia megaterium]|uniref:PTS sugar transporter subunit IIA n=1 Tax=Priestia megaterium TaxID=1404 RepID=UPI000BFE6781|nr:fructose PTS transporter subunit IIA [Priestia megaterium]PGN53180.1 PTS fructose transporter subunit IIA [Priestia megaterium]PGQ87617.1 PTS fructose transporter subunit IIA [Priestia megaterium]